MGMGSLLSPLSLLPPLFHSIDVSRGAGGVLRLLIAACLYS